jgi:tryptophan synthase alpha chain
MNRLQTLFSKKQENLLSVFYTAGFPKLSSTIEVGEALEKAGADLIEIGIPFSDPVADGPAIQESNKIALDNGMNVRLLLSQVKELRQKVSLPIILMGYLNPVLQYGMDKFCSDCSAAGVDGLILPDLPLDVYLKEYQTTIHHAGLSITFLVSPTTSDQRIRLIDENSDAFIYAVSASSTTGAKKGFNEEQLQYFDRLKKMKLKTPLMVGFGISSKDTFQQACEYSTGAIIGSAFITMLRSSQHIDQDVDAFVRMIRS